MNQNRRRWLRWLPVALLPMAAKAETVVTPNWHRPVGNENFLFTGEYEKALNNQCPVCGTMAPVMKASLPGERCNGTHTSINIPEWPPCIDRGSPWLTMCARCNAAFYRRAE